MEKLEKLFLLVVVVTIFSGSLVDAREKLEEDQYGNVYVMRSERTELSKEKYEACAHPGREVLINPRSVKPERKIRFNKDFFYMVPVQEYDEAVVCKIHDGKMKVSMVEKHGVKRGDKKPAIYVTFLLVSMFFVVMFIINAVEGSNLAILFITFAFVATGAAILTAATTFATFAAFFAILAFAAVVSLALSAYDKNIKACKISSVIFYILAGIALVV